MSCGSLLKKPVDDNNEVRSYSGAYEICARVILFKKSRLALLNTYIY